MKRAYLLGIVGVAVGAVGVWELVQAEAQDDLDPGRTCPPSYGSTILTAAAS